MSQASGFGTGGGGGTLSTLTGNSGGAVSPTAGNINVRDRAFWVVLSSMGNLTIV